VIRITSCVIALCSMVAPVGSAAHEASSSQLAGTRITGGCDVPVAQRTSETGCYLVATAPLGTLPTEPQYWHLYQYPTKADAERSVGPRGMAVNSFGRDWVYTIAAKDWRPASGDRIAVLGPFATSPSKPYTARYMEAVFAPGMQVGPPMALSGVGTDTRRSVLLVLHESSQPWMTVTTEWKPAGRCPK
jgi:hypothetical protein